MDPIEVHTLEYTGKTVTEKLKMIVDDLESNNFSNLFITRLDSIAWLLNIRGRDIPKNPVIFAYFLFAKKEGTWTYTVYPRDFSKFTSDVTNHICPAGQSCVEVSENYNLITEELSDLTGVILLPGTGTTYGIDAAVRDAGVAVATGNCPVEYLKSIKNEVEISWIKHFSLLDSVAIAETLMTVEYSVKNNIKTTELDVDAQVIKSRTEIGGEDYKGESFGAISAAGPNGAIIHYGPTAESNRQVFENETFLLDSGGQYLGATTDITRTLFIGNPTSEIKRRYTRVLQGSTRLANSIFPVNTPGYKMDPVARQPLFQDHQSYGHGTGHGIGYYLLIHEAPNSIRKDPSTMQYAG